PPSVQVPVPDLITVPVPLRTPSKLVELWSPPVLSVPPPSRMFGPGPPETLPTVCVTPLRSSVAPEFVSETEVVGERTFELPTPCHLRARYASTDGRYSS